MPTAQASIILELIEPCGSPLLPKPVPTEGERTEWVVKVTANTYPGSSVARSKTQEKALTQISKNGCDNRENRDIVGFQEMPEEQEEPGILAPSQAEIQ